MYKNKEYRAVGTSSHGHGQTFGSDNDGTLTKVVLNFRSLRHPDGVGGVSKILM